MAVFPKPTGHLAHKHLVVNTKINYPPKNEFTCKVFLRDLIESIGMKVATLSNDQPNPIAWYCDDPDNQGMTATAILTTSHTALHIWDKLPPYSLKFDLYSCSSFSVQHILDLLDSMFKIYETEAILIDRDDTIKIIRL